MIEKCINCGTSFNVDKNLITNDKKLFSCSICNHEWEIKQDSNNFLQTENLERELEAIRTEIKKNTSKIKNSSLKNRNKSQSKTNENNKVFNVKKKSVAEIASEIASAKEKKEISLQKNNQSTKRKNLIKEDIYSDNSPPVNLAIPAIMLMIILIFSASMYYRSTIVGLSYAYFPLKTEKHFPKVLQLFEKVKIPFNAELNKIEISNFGATYEKNAIKFFGNIKNNSVLPIIVPSIKAIVVTEDGKILAETLIPITKKYILSKNDLNFSYLFKTKRNFENTTVRATLLKKIHL